MITKPTPEMFGYGDGTTPMNVVMRKDKRTLYAMAAESPQLFTPSAPKPPDNAVMKVVRAALAKDGMEGRSMSLRYLSIPLMGVILQFLAQLIGSCVASGAMRVLARRIFAELLVQGQAERWLGTQPSGRNNFLPFAPYHYGCGRRRGNMRGGDGSYCSVQVEALLKDGFLRCDAPALERIVGLNSSDYPETQSTSLYRRFGDWQYLDELRPIALENTLADAEFIDPKMIERVITAVCEELKGAMICSDWAFRLSHRHKDGFHVYVRDTSDSWPHNLSLSGFRWASDGNIYAEIDNSWGAKAHHDGSFFYLPLEVFVAWMRVANAAILGELKLRPLTLGPPQLFTAV